VALRRALAATLPTGEPQSREGTLPEMTTRDVAVGEGPLRGPRGGWARGGWPVRGARCMREGSDRAWRAMRLV
jgi:hypothetical protein